MVSHLFDYMVSKKKVTLSIDTRIYNNFQRYCSENAIVVSKRIEIFMKDFFQQIRKRKIVSSFFMLFIGIFLINFVSAATIFSDNFESGGLGGWTLSKASGANDWTASTTNPYQGAYHAQSQPMSTTEPASVMQKTVSTSGYSNIILNYTRRLVGIDGVDEFQVEWYDGVSWTIVEQTGGNSADDATYVSKQFSLSAAADNNANFAIKFECTAGATSEYCRVDDLLVSGTVSDSTSPSFSNYTENPSNGSVYLSGQFYEFNVTITDSGGVNSVGIEFNGVNYTGSNFMRNISGVYSFNRTNLAAGTYSYSWWANDSNGNYGSGSVKSYTIEKTASRTSLVFDKTSPQTYGTQINASCSIAIGVGSVVLYREGVDVTSTENGKLATLGAGTHNYNCSLASSQNYSASENISSFIINQASTTTTVFVSPTSPIIYGTASNFSCSNSQGLDITLYVDSVNKTNEKGVNVTRAAGTYNVNCTSYDNQNYSGSSNQTSYTINKATLTASLFNSTSWTVNYGTSVTINYTESNSGDGDLTYKIYRDSVDKGAGESVTLGVGSYSYLLNTTGGQNYSDVSNLDNDTLIVNKTDPSSNMQIVITPSLTVNYGTQTSATGSETNTGDGGLTYNFYRNGGGIANPNTETLNAGTYNYTYNTTGGANYTFGSVNTTLIVDKIGNAVSLLLNGGTSNLTLIYPQQVNASASSTSGVVSLFRNGTNVLSQNGVNVTLGVGFYQYFVNSSGNQNYLTNTTGTYLSVNITPEPDTQPPTTSIFSPLPSTTYTSNVSLDLNYSVIDFNGVDSCWYNIGFGTNISLLSCMNTTFNVSGEGTFIFYLYANDSLGNVERDSVTFFVDLTGINISLIEPTGTKSSRTGIPITYNVTGNNVSCLYNIKTSIGGSVIENTSLVNCSSSSFDVASDGDYILNLYSNNSLGTFKNVSSSFSVSTSSVGGSSGGGGGGGGGGGSTTIITNVTNVKIELFLGSISDMLVNPGDSKKLSLNSKNSGTAFLNDCKLNGIGGYSSWISSSGTKSLNVGEDYDFSFDVNIPEQTAPGKYTISVSLECQEITKNVDFNVEIMEKKIGFNLIKIEDIGNNQIKISYSLEELSGKEQDVELQFLLFDASEEKVGEIKESKPINANSKADFETLMPVDRLLEGELSLLVNINSEEYSSFVEENVVLGRATGFAILNGGNGDKIVSAVLIILFLIFAFFVVKRILMHKRRLKWFREIRGRKR